MSQKQTLAFQAEVQQILHLVTHSLYSNKEIFLRELVSNASDACDKLRFEALDNAALFEDAPELKVHVSFDAEAKTVTIRDNGIGMSADEAVSHLGTIAKSGTREFMARLEGDQKKDANLIGQFGVGFYSGFIVADRITVESRRAGLKPDEGVRWSSDGSGQFEVETITRAERGTEVTLHLREGEEEFLKTWKLKSIISKYSDHISLPILMKKEEWIAEKAETVLKDEWETVNKAAALWTRPKSDITDAQYQEFYKQISLRQRRAAGLHPQPRRGPQRVHATALHPGQGAVRPVEPRQARRRQALRQARLHHGRRRGPDAGVPALRQGRDRQRRPAAERQPRVAAGKPRREGRFARARRSACCRCWRTWPRTRRTSTPRSGKTSARCIKEGVGEDHANQERLAKLLRFASTHADEGVSFADYVARLKEGQDPIYYITADTLAAAKASPQLEIFRKKGIEVLLLADRVDEWMLSHLYEFEGHPLQSVAKGSVDLGTLQDEAEKKEAEAAATAFAPLQEKLKVALKERAKDVRVTTRLVDSPACIVVEEGDMSCAPGADVQAGWSTGAEGSADPGSQCPARVGQAHRTRRRAFRRPRAAAVRPGLAGRRRASSTTRPSMFSASRAS